MAEPPLTGGCLCGAIRFEISKPPRSAGYCHCTRCQRRTGTGSSVQAHVDPATFRFTSGEELLRGWRHPDGGFEKCFCSVCGGHLISRNPDEPNLMSVRLGAFDGDPGVELSWHAFVGNAPAWAPVPDDGLARYEGRVPRA